MLASGVPRPKFSEVTLHPTPPQKILGVTYLVEDREIAFMRQTWQKDRRSLSTVMMISHIHSYNMCIPTVAHSKDPVTAVRSAIQSGVDKGGGDFPMDQELQVILACGLRGIPYGFTPLRNRNCKF